MATQLYIGAIWAQNNTTQEWQFSPYFVEANSDMQASSMAMTKCLQVYPSTKYMKHDHEVSAHNNQKPLLNPDFMNDLFLVVYSYQLNNYPTVAWSFVGSTHNDGIFHSDDKQQHLLQFRTQQLKGLNFSKLDCNANIVPKELVQKYLK